jgi:hypothetical protein
VNCSQCDEAPAVLVLRNEVLGVEYPACEPCATRITRWMPDVRIGGPAPTRRGRAAWVRRLIRERADALCSSLPLTRLLRSLPDDFVPPEARMMAADLLGGCKDRD